MYFPSDGHFPEFKFKIHSLTIKTMIRNQNLPGRSKTQVYLIQEVRQVKVTTHPFPSLPYDLSLFFPFFFSLCASFLFPCPSVISTFLSLSQCTADPGHRFSLLGISKVVEALHEAVQVLREALGIVSNQIKFHAPLLIVTKSSIMYSSLLPHQALGKQITEKQWYMVILTLL